MIEPGKLYAKMIAAGNDWADKDSAANLLEETRKPVLADLMTRSAATTSAAREELALSSPEYKEHIAAMVEARREANRARAQYDAIKTYIELVRTKESTNRAEMQLAR